MNYDQMTISEMEEIYNKLGEEIKRRKDAEVREDWKKLVEQIQLFVERYGPIRVINDINEEDYIDCEMNFGDLGLIYLSRI